MREESHQTSEYIETIIDITRRVRLKIPESSYLILLLSFHYAQIVIAETFIGRNLWGKSFSENYGFINKYFKIYHFSISLNEKEDLFTIRIATIIALTLLQLLILLSICIRLTNYFSWSEKATSVFLNNYVTWLNYIGAPIAIDLFTNQVFFSNTIAGTFDNALKLDMTIGICSIGLVALVANITVSLTASCAFFFELGKEKYRMRQNAIPEVLFLISCFLRTSIYRLRIDDSSMAYITFGLIVLSFFSSNISLRGTTLAYSPARTSYSTGFTLILWVDTCSLLSTFSGDLISNPFFILLGGIGLILLINSISTQQFNNEILGKEMADLESPEAVCCKLLNLATIFHRRLNYSDDRNLFLGFLENHMTHCTRAACPLVMNLKSSKTISEDPFEYVQSMERIFIEYMNAEFTKALKHFPNSVRIRVIYAEVLLVLAERPHAALDMLISCQTISMTFFESITYEMLYNNIVENSGVLGEPSFKRNKDLKVRKIHLKTRLIARNLSLLLRNAVSYTRSFWLILTQESPDVKSVFETLILASQHHQTLTEFWKQKNISLKQRSQENFRYGYYLRMMTSQKEEGLRMLIESKEMLAKATNANYELSNISKAVDLSKHYEGLALLVEHKNKWVIAQCNQTFSIALGFSKTRILNTALQRFFPKAVSSEYISKISSASKAKKRISSYDLYLLKRFVDLRPYRIEIKAIEIKGESKELVVKIHPDKQIHSISYCLIDVSERVINLSVNTKYIFPGSKLRSKKKIHIRDLFDGNVADQFSNICKEFLNGKLQNEKGRFFLSSLENQKQISYRLIRINKRFTVVSLNIERLNELQQENSLSNKGEYSLGGNSSRISNQMQRHKHTSKIIFRFDFDPETEDIVGGFAASSKVMNVSNYFKRNTVSIKNKFSKVVSTGQSALNAVKQLGRDNKRIDYTEGIKTARLIKNKIADALEVNEEDFLNELRAEENIGRSLFIENKKAVVGSITEAKGKHKSVSENKKENYLNNTIQKLRKKHPVYLLISAHLIFLIVVLIAELFFVYKENWQMNLRKYYGQCLNNISSLTNELNCVASNLIALILFNRGEYYTELGAEAFLEFIKNRLKDNVLQMEIADTEIMEIIQKVSSEEIAYEYIHKRETEMIYLNGPSKNVTLNEGIKQIQTSLIDIAGRDLQTINESNSQLYFAYINTNMKTQEQLFNLQSDQYWNYIENKYLTQGTNLTTKILIRISIGTLFSLLFFIISLLYGRNIDKIMEVVYTFDISDAANMVKAADSFSSLILTDNSDSLSELGDYDLESNRGILDMVDKENDNDEEIVLIKQRKIKESISSHLNWLYIPGILTALFIILSSLIVLIIKSDNIAKINAIQELRRSVYNTVNNNKFMITMIERVIVDPSSKVWNGTVEPLELAMRMNAESGNADRTFAELYVNDFDMDYSLKSLYNQMFTGNLCEFISTLDDSDTILFPASQPCEQIYDSILTQGLFPTLQAHSSNLLSLASSPLSFGSLLQFACTFLAPDFSSSGQRGAAVFHVLIEGAVFSINNTRVPSSKPSLLVLFSAGYSCRWRTRDLQQCTHCTL